MPPRTRARAKEETASLLHEHLDTLALVLAALPPADIAQAALVCSAFHEAVEAAVIARMRKHGMARLPPLVPGETTLSLLDLLEVNFFRLYRTTVLRRWSRKLAVQISGCRYDNCNGVFVEAVTDISEHWQADFVAFALGCSYSFEEALVSAGLPLRHLELGREVGPLIGVDKLDTLQPD